mmetsp:Transcript_5305/g.6937  ORF Transcript_5305/g.6937 Transcript_5305/m.6937 type:complete len:277 (-) Transcript_5305:374-1204(-)
MRISVSGSTFVFNLFLDPEICFLEAILDFHCRFPSQLFFNEDVIGVASPDPHGSINMLDGQFLVFKRKGNIGKFNHVHHFGRSQVDGHLAIRKGESQNTLNAIINKGETTCLLAVTPHFKVFRRSKCLTAKSCRSLFAATLPSSTRPIYIMKASNSDIQIKISSIRQGHFFRIKFFKSVHILRPGGPRVGFNQTRIFRIFLFGFIVYTSGTSVKEVLSSATSSSFQHVHGNGGIVKGQDRFVRDDETHAAHIGCEVVHLCASDTSIAGHFEFAQIP